MRRGQSTGTDTEDGRGPLRDSYHLLGLAFWQAWWMCAMCTSAILPHTQTYAFAGDAALWVLVTTTVGYLAIVLASRRVVCFSAHPCAFWLAGGLTSIGSAVLPLSLYLLGGTAGLCVFLVGAVAVAVGNALLLMMWGELWSSLATSRVGRHLYLSYSFAFVLFAVVWFLPGLLQGLLVSVFPAISAWILRSCRDEPRRSPSVVPVPQGAVPVRTIIIAILLVSIVYGISQNVVTGFAPDDGAPYMLYTMVFAGLCIGLMALDMVVEQNPMEPMKLYRPVIPSFAAGLIGLLVLPARFSFIGAGLIIVGIYCLDMLMMLVSTDIAFRSRTSVALSFGLVILMARTGTLIGTALMQGIQASPSWSLTLRDDIVLLGVLVVVFVGTLLFTQLDLRALYDTAHAAEETPSLEGKCADISRMCNLSAREAEVLVLLARGRNIPYICEELSIAQGTAKHHVSSIYRKIGVYDRQSLHDVIENGGVGRATTPQG